MENAPFFQQCFIIPQCQELLVFQVLEGVFQLLFRIRNVSGGIKGLSLFIQDGVGIAVLVQPIPQRHIPENLCRILRHPAIFHAGPVGGQLLRLTGKHQIRGFRHRFLIGLLSQQILVCQDEQPQSPAHRNQQGGRAEGHSNEFQP